MSNFSEFEFRTQPWFKQGEISDFVRTKIPMKTLVIQCFDPRADEIPHAVAAFLENEVYPGETLFDAVGNKVGSTRTLFSESNAGGRAISALQSIATMEYLFGVKNVVVVHHSFCGATALTSEVLINDFKHEHQADISESFDEASLAIDHFENSLRYDVQLLRSSPAVPN